MGDQGQKAYSKVKKTFLSKNADSKKLASAIEDLLDGKRPVASGSNSYSSGSGTTGYSSGSSGSGRTSGSGDAESRAL